MQQIVRIIIWLDFTEFSLSMKCPLEPMSLNVYNNSSNEIRFQINQFISSYPAESLLLC